MIVNDVVRNKKSNICCKLKMQLFRHLVSMPSTTAWDFSSQHSRFPNWLHLTNAKTTR